MSVRIVKYGITIMLLSFVALLSSCASSNVREAQKVVAQADSLWHEGKTYGVDMGDRRIIYSKIPTFISSHTTDYQLLTSNQIPTLKFAHFKKM